MKNEEYKVLLDEYECIDQNRGRYIYDYMTGAVSETQKQEFEDHLILCLKCQEDVEYMRSVVRRLKAYEEQKSTERIETLPEIPLTVTMIADRNDLDITPDYYGESWREELAASTGTSDTFAFPITVEYADGRVIAQFLKRMGQVFFRLKEVTIDPQEFECALVYTPSCASSAEAETFECQEEREIRLGTFHELFPADTPQGTLDGIKQFQCVLKHKEKP